MNIFVFRYLPWLGIMIVTGLLSAAEVPAAKDAAESMNHARALLQKWAETERLTAAERHEWEQGKALLEGRITLVKQSISEMKKKIAEAEAKLADAKKRTEEAEVEKAQAKEASDALLTAATELETGVRGLILRVPANVKEKVKVLADRIPKEGAEVKNITAAERYQNVLGILNELNKSNLEIASLPEIHDVGNGKKAEVKTLYVGLGQAYFVNAAGDIGGVGTPGAQDWEWTTDPSIAKRVIEVVEVMKKTVSPKLVELPASID
ncbi:uncharacterized protein DUF3450 [Prosthecobacter fusiformis]|uniref:Uncharacterized protein DUF3450 n=1 Tax=Prosthecobacter fusiformis TaxID=48464 RepID=A0A4R7S4W1_9BACT|nr:DUF3450 family protein [Prosthecobacter fusiformis]TDU72899.1 uncharacterized protein DUF3450 [Prosthecobacter fusiformis]